MSNEYKVRYHDGRVQPIEADGYDSAGDNWVFAFDGQEIAIIAKKSVESIALADVPDPQLPEVEQADFGRAPRTGPV